MRSLLSLVFVLLGYYLSAQDSTFVTIKAGNKIKDVLSLTDIYYYPQFTSGKVFFQGKPPVKIFFVFIN